MAAREVYRFLGVPERLGISMNPGGARPDLDALLEFVAVHWSGRKPTRDFQKLPYPDAKPSFSWSAPGKKK